MWLSPYGAELVNKQMVLETSFTLAISTMLPIYLLSLDTNLLFLVTKMWGASMGSAAVPATRACNPHRSYLVITHSYTLYPTPSKSLPKESYS